MDRETKRQIMRRQLVVIRGGLGLEGPVTRLNAWERFEGTSTRTVALLALGKIALLASVAYYFYF